MKRLNWLIYSMILIMVSCTKSSDDPDDTPSDCDSAAKSFVANVSPLILNTCTSSDCHGSGSINGPGPLLTYNAIFTARVSIRNAVSTGLMPKNSSLTTAQKNTILCWIDSGAPNN